MKNILTVKHITCFILFGVFLLLNTSLFAAFACQSPKVQCCTDGKRSCCNPLSGGLQYDISCYMGSLIEDPIIVDPIIEDDPYIPTSCTEGKKKYTAQVNGCETKEETCCSGEWCSKSCKSCTDTSGTKSCSGNIDHATGGTLTVTRSVKSSCGSCSYTAWVSSGSCTCANGYEWKNGQCQSTVTPNTGTWHCSLGTLVHVPGITIPKCTVITTNPPWPTGRTCYPDSQEYCEGSWFEEGGNVVEGGTNSSTPFYCWCG